MFHQGFITVAVLTNAVIGNLCMMPMALSLASDVPMALAQGMEMPHEEHMEMTMTPMLAMSPVHCEHCATVQPSDSDPSQQQSGCAGHCFSQAQSTTASTATFNTPHVVAAAPIPIIVAFDPQTTSVVIPPALSPPISIHIGTIVLRL